MESLATIENSLRYSLANIRKIMIETEMLRLEFAGLKQLADTLGDYHRTVLPVEKARLSDDELFYKWSEQISRYRATAKGINEIFESKHERLKELFKLAGEKAKQLPRPLPEDITQQFEELSEYGESFSNLTS